jgi:hypothetical protein
MGDLRSMEGWEKELKYREAKEKKAERKQYKLNIRS